LHSAQPYGKGRRAAQARGVLGLCQLPPYLLFDGVPRLPGQLQRLGGTPAVCSHNTCRRSHATHTDLGAQLLQRERGRHAHRLCPHAHRPRQSLTACTARPRARLAQVRDGAVQAALRAERLPQEVVRLRAQQACLGARLVRRKRLLRDGSALQSRRAQRRTWAAPCGTCSLTRALAHWCRPCYGLGETARLEVLRVGLERDPAVLRRALPLALAREAECAVHAQHGQLRRQQQRLRVALRRAGSTRQGSTSKR